MADMPHLSYSGLGLVHLNVQSLVPKIEELRMLTDKVLPDVLCISESWLTHLVPDGFIGIQDYVAFRLDRQTGKRGGGLVSYFNLKILQGLIMIYTMTYGDQMKI